MTNISLVRIGGVSAILAFVSFAAGGIVYFAGVEQVDSDDLAQVLTAVNDSRAASLTATWIVLAGYVLLIPAALGLFHALQEAGAVVLIAAAAMFTGTLLFMGAAIISLGIIDQLAPGYAEASDVTRPALMVMASTLDKINDIANDAGLLLLPGIGVLLFALVIIRTSIMPSWVGWLAFPAAIVEWLSTLEPVLGAQGALSGVSFVLFMVWMLVMGVVLVRLREPVAPSG